MTLSGHEIAAIVLGAVAWTFAFFSYAILMKVKWPVQETEHKPRTIKTREETVAADVEPEREIVEVEKTEIKYIYKERVIEPVSEREAVKGLRVVRGPEWAHGDQDGGKGNYGTLHSSLGDGWWMVIWDAAEKNRVDSNVNEATKEYGLRAYNLNQLSVAPKVEV